MPTKWTILWRVRRLPTCFWLIFALFLLLLGCRQDQATDAEPAPSAEVTATVEAETEETQATETEPLTADEAPSEIQLRIWIPPELEQLANEANLAAQIANFAEQNDSLLITVETKSVTEFGGMFSYLRLGQDVAPSIMPDLLVLPSQALVTASAENLLRPWNSSETTTLNDDLLATLYPAAKALGTVDDALLGVPLATYNLLHLVYSDQLASDQLPRAWDQLIESETAQLALPSTGPIAGNVALQLYLSSGAALTNDEGDLTFQSGPLTKAFSRIETAYLGERLATDSVTANSAADAWALFTADDANMVVVSSEFVLTELASDEIGSVAAITGAEGVQTPLIKTWNWSLITDDPAKQREIVSLIEFLNDPDGARWLESAGLLPVRPDGLRAFDAALADYTVFIDSELARAQPFPLVVTPAVNSALTDGVQNVMSRFESPLNAAQTIISTVNDP